MDVELVDVLGEGEDDVVGVGIADVTAEEEDGDEGITTAE